MAGHEISVLSSGTGACSGRPSLFCLSRKDEEMVVEITGYPGFISKGDGAYGNEPGLINSLSVQRINRLTLKCILFNLRVLAYVNIQ